MDLVVGDNKHVRREMGVGYHRNLHWVAGVKRPVEMRIFIIILLGFMLGG